MDSNLLSPLPIGKTQLRNRICFLAHRTNFAQGGRLTDHHIAYYRRRAEGECGLIILGELSIHPDDRPWEAMIEGYRPEVVADYKRLTTAVHALDVPIFAQLNHHGFQASGAITRQPVWGPSAVADVVFGETAKTMELEDMAVVKDAFARAAVLARDGGFDGLEIDMGEESLLRQFLSPLSNYRQDQYGGSLENRMRLPLEVIEAVVRAVGPDFTLGIRICADEIFWGAITTEESVPTAQQFVETGHIDFVNVTLGTYYNLYLTQATMHTPKGFSLAYAEKIKQAVAVPVIAGYQINSPEMAEAAIAEGKTDAVGFVRPLICDPDFPRKVRLGEHDAIRFCALDNQGCVGRTNQSKVLACTQNPAVGQEAIAGQESYEEALWKKRVLVVGAGPAGLEAARVARLRGHDVTILEKKSRVGGQINLIQKRAARSEMGAVIRYLEDAVGKLKVPVIRDTEATVENVQNWKPDAVIVATGSYPRSKPVDGDYAPPEVLTVWDVLEGQYPIGEKILFIDEHGGHYSASTVEMLADQGKKIDMVTSDLFIGIELAPIGDLYLGRQRLLTKGVTFRTDVVIDRIDGNRARGRDIYTNDAIVFEGYDTIVAAMGNMPDDRLYKQLKDRFPECYRAGDCVAPRGIGMAILEGRRIGERI